MTTQVVTMPQAEVLPALSRVLGRVLSEATPDAIVDLIGDVNWLRCDEWESLGDLELARTTGLLDIALSGPLLLITEASFAPDRGGFIVPASRLANFVAEHLKEYGECFFNGDVIVAELQGRKVWLFHHEGLHALAIG